MLFLVLPFVMGKNKHETLIINARVFSKAFASGAKRPEFNSWAGQVVKSDTAFRTTRQFPALALFRKNKLRGSSVRARK